MSGLKQVERIYLGDLEDQQEIARVSSQFGLEVDVTRLQGIVSVSGAVDQGNPVAQRMEPR